MIIIIIMFGSPALLTIPVHRDHTIPYQGILPSISMVDSVSCLAMPSFPCPRLHY